MDLGAAYGMPVVSPTAEERSRKATSLVLQRLAPDGTQRNLAQVFGVSESTVSRMKEQIEPVMRLVAQLGLKVVPIEMKCYRPDDIEPYIQIAKQHMRKVENADHLVWDEE